MNRVRFHCFGRWGRGQIDVSWSSDSRPRFSEIELAIDQIWQETSARLGDKLFDGPMCRMESFACEEKLSLVFSLTSYKAFLGTNLGHARWAEKYGKLALANPVGVSSALETSDGYLMMGRRNDSVAYYPLRVHPFAGALEPALPGQVDIFSEVERELSEELRFTSKDIAGIECLGIAEDVSILQPELILRVRTPRTRAEVEKTLDAHEHTGAMSIAINPRALAETVLDPVLTPIASATFLMWGRVRFGDRWFDAAAAPVIVRS